MSPWYLSFFPPSRVGRQAADSIEWIPYKYKIAINKAGITGMIVVIVLVLAGCSEHPGSTSEPDPSNPAGSIPEVVDPDVSIVLPGTKISQLVGDYDRERKQPTQNQTYTRYQLRATDLGVPFQDGERTYVLFGDTWGVVGGARDVIAYTTDTDPEDGFALDFYEDDNGAYLPLTIPGISQAAFEVPVEGLMVNDKMYIYHTTDHSSQVTMGRSVVARSNDGGNTFTYLYNFSSRYFRNISIVKVPVSDWELLPENEGTGLVIFGSGIYRKSNVFLAFQPASGIENPESIRYFSGIDDVGEPLWSTSEAEAEPVFKPETSCVGELSVSYNTFIDRWILLYNCGNPRGINMRTARNPWGPWTRSQVLFHPWKDEGYCHFMHASSTYEKCDDDVHDPGRENVWGGEYGPYQFEHFATGDSLSTTIYFTMSTWNPYTVVLMKAELHKGE